MGTDNLQRKAKETKGLKRKKAERSGDLILIVCEGEKTEPYYITELLKDLKINKSSAIVEVSGDCGSAPQSVVDHAIKKFENKDYDHIFCVFDKDKHHRFNDAIQRMRDFRWTKKNGRDIFKVTTKKAIVSIPCFEYWLLLHFENTTKVFNGNGQDVSPCKECLNELRQKKNFTEYEKGHSTTYDLTKVKLDIAITRSKNIVQNKSTDYQNPITYFHELVEFLREFK